MTIDANTIIGDLLDYNDGCEQILLSMGMNCIGCPASRGETLREACEIHGIAETELIGKLREHMGK